MDLIERYLHAVKTYLPQAQQDDVVAELAEDVRSRIEERETELGRRLDEAEVAAVLKRLGHPSRLAAGYGSWQQLIGPVLFPMYRRILKLALGIALLVNVVLAAVLLATGHPPAHAFKGVMMFPFITAIMVFGWVTLVFALIDAKVGPTALGGAVIAEKQWFDRWDPRTLPPVPRHRSAPPRWQLVLDLVGALFFLGWWLALPSNPFLLFGPGASVLAPGPGLLQAYVPVAIVAVVVVILRAFALARPDARRMLSLASSLLGVAGAALFLWNRGPYIVAAAGAAAPPALLRALPWIDTSIVVGMVFVSVMTSVDIVRTAWRLRRPESPVAGASTPPGSLR